MASPHSVDYTSFSKDDLVSLIESKVNTINLYENEMQSCTSKIESLKKEKQELATLNMTLSHGFSTLEAFVANILGQKNMREMRDKDNNYDLEKLKSTFTRYYNSRLNIVQTMSYLILSNLKYLKSNISYSDAQALRENNDSLMAKLEKLVLQEENNKILKKKVEEWGGESYIKTCISKLKTLQLESDSKDAKIKELTDKLSVEDQNKGTELLTMLNVAEEQNTDKSKANLLLEVSQKSNQILELKDQLEEALEKLRIVKAGNPFEKAGGSDDEDNKERIVQRNSIDTRVIYKISISIDTR